MKNKIYIRPPANKDMIVCVLSYINSMHNKMIQGIYDIVYSDIGFLRYVQSRLVSIFEESAFFMLDNRQPFVDFCKLRGYNHAIYESWLSFLDEVETQVKKEYKI